MTSIIVIETESDSELLQDIMNFMSERKNCQCTQFQTELPNDSEKLLSFPGLSIDLEQWTITKKDKQVSMSYYEFQILACLANQSGRVFTKEQLYNKIYGDEKIVDVDNAVYCIICSIRKKLSNAWKNHEYI